MGSVRMFRDRVVSMEQTQEIGEKHIGLLGALAAEALPGFAVAAHGLEHERDHYWLSLSNAETGATCRVAFTRMFLSDAGRLPAVVADEKAGVREQIVACIRAQAGRAEILVTVAGLLTEEERAEREEIDSEWRKKNEAALAAKRAEDERRARERQRQKQQEEARRQSQREREKRERAAAGGPAGQSPQGEGARAGRRRRRGRGGAGSSAASQPGGGADGGRAQQPRQPQVARAAGPAPGPRPQSPLRSAQPAGAPPSEGGQAEGAGGGGRRRRRRGRGRGGPGGPRPGGTSPPGAGPAGGSNQG
ncbi:MAG: hypothetical protein PT977_06745 [Acidobacteriota bacterium]|nr:hypothetical protein [Acidobacteriota bacterium]